MRSGGGTIENSDGADRQASGWRCALFSCALVSLLLMASCERRETGGRVSVVATIGEVGIWPGQFVMPRGMDVASGTLVVVDKTARIQLIDPESGKSEGEWKTPRHEKGMPIGLTMATLGGKRVLLVADTHEHRVLVYDASGGGVKGAEGGARRTAWEIIGEFGSFGYGPGEFIYVTDVAVAHDPVLGTRIYVSEYGGNDRVSVFDGSFRFLFSFGTFGTGRDESRVEFNRPQSLLFDPVRRELLVADSCNHRIGRFTLDGELLGWIGEAGEPGSALGAFRYPYSMAMLDDGTVLVAEYENSRVQRVDVQRGVGLETFGTPGRGEGQLAGPWAICVIDRTAYVLDTGNNRIVAFRSPRPAMAPELWVASAGDGGAR